MGLGLVVPRWPGLIGHQAAKEAAIVELAHCAGRPRHQVEIFDSVQVARLDIEHAVSIEKNGPSSHPRPA